MTNNLEVIARNAVKPIPRTSIGDWCCKNVKLNARYSSSSGFWKPDKTPYAVEWLNAFASKRVRQVTLVTAAQLSKTQIMIDAVLWAIANDPAPTIFAQNTEHNARSFSEGRFQTAMRDCAAVAATIPQDEDKFKLLEMHLRDMPLWLVGTNSAGNLASRSVKYVFGDEVDKWGEETDSEANALDLLKARVTTYWDSKILLASTPTVEQTSLIWREYLQGTQEHYHVPCPHCHMKQVLEFKQLKWASTEDINRLRNSAYYECAFCKKPILPNQKAAMLANGEWRADNLQADGSHRSFHLSSLYSPESWKSWGEIAVEWKKCHKDRSGLHNFINSTLAELWAEKIEEADFTTLDARQADYDPATENWGLQKRRIMTVDVQADGQWFQWLVMSWGLAGACRVLAWGKCFNLNEVQSKALEWKVDSVGIDDNGSVAPQIDQWCAAHQKNPMWNPIRGVTVPHFTSMASGREVKRAWEVQNVDAFIGTAMQGKQGVIRRFLLCADTNKDMLWALIHGKVGQFQFPKTEGFGKDFKESLLSEQPREKIVSGFTKRVWTKIHRRNEIFDLCYYSVAIAGILGLLQSVEANLADQPAVATAGNTT